MKNEKSAHKASAASPWLTTIFFGKGLAELTIALLILAIYFSVLSFGYTHFDDTLIIERNKPFITDLANIGKAFTTDAFVQTGTGTFYRPLQTVSFMLDAKLFGAKPQSFHITNLLLHIVTSIVVFRLLRRLRIGTAGAYAAAMIFAAHPLLTHAVAWIPARGDLLLGLFSALSALLFARYAEGRKLVELILSVLAFALALFSKETAAALPVMLIGLWLLLMPSGAKDRQLWLSIILYATVGAIWFAIRSSAVLGGGTESELFGIESLIRNIQTLPDLVSKFYLPIDASPMPVFRLSFTLIGIAYLIATFFFMRWQSNSERNAILFGLIWFAMLTLPGMLIRHSEADHFYDYLDHRAYLPVIGLLPVLAVLFEQERKRFPRGTAIVTIAVVAILGTGSFVRSGDYRNPETLFRSAIEHNPKSAVAYTNLGVYYTESGKFREAYECQTKAIEVYPGYCEALINRADAASRLGMIDTARQDLYYVIEHKQKSYQIAIFNLGSTYLNAGMYDSSITRFREALATKPDWHEATDNIAKAFFNRGTKLAEKQNFADALPQFDSALATKPDYPDALNNRGNTRWMLGNQTGACDDWSRSAELGNKIGKENISKYCKK